MKKIFPFPTNFPFLPTTNMTDSYAEQEARISRALEDYTSGKNQNLSALAREHRVNYQRLRRRSIGLPSKIGNQNRPRLLTGAQEDAIIRTIDSLRRYNIKLNGKDIEDLANLLLWRQYERDHPEATVPKTSAILPRLANAEILPPGLKLVNHQWAYSFIKRINPKIRPTADDQISSGRATVSAAMMQNWFDALEPVIKQIKHYNIYNFDETGFILGQQSSRTSLIGRKRARAELAETQESLTAIECISPDGFALPPFFIFTGSVILERWFDESPDPDWVVSVAKSGYINSDIAFEWLQHFDKHTQKRAGNG
jgi:hypothetical protein